MVRDRHNRIPQDYFTGKPTKKRPSSYINRTRNIRKARKLEAKLVPIIPECACDESLEQGSTDKAVCHKEQTYVVVFVSLESHMGIKKLYLCIFQESAVAIW